MSATVVTTVFSCCHSSLLRLLLLQDAVGADSTQASRKVPPKRTSQIQDGFGINSDLPRDPYLPWNRWWWTRMFDAGFKWIRIGQYENSSDSTSWDWVEQKRGVFAVVAGGGRLRRFAGGQRHESAGAVDVRQPDVHVARAAKCRMSACPSRALFTTTIAASTPSTGRRQRRSRSPRSISTSSGWWTIFETASTIGHCGTSRTSATGIRGAIRSSMALAGAVCRDRAQDRSAGEGDLRRPGGSHRASSRRRALDTCKCASRHRVYAYHTYPGYGQNMNPETMDYGAYLNESPRACANW